MKATDLRSDFVEFAAPSGVTPAILRAAAQVLRAAKRTATSMMFRPDHNMVRFYFDSVSSDTMSDLIDKFKGDEVPEGAPS